MSDDVVFVHGTPVRVPDGEWRRGDGPRVVVRFGALVDAPLRAALARAGVTVRFWCPPSGACVDLPDRSGVLEHAVPGAVGAVPYDAAACSREVVPPSVVGRDVVDVVVFARADREAVARRLRRAGHTVLAQERCKLRVRLAPGAAPADLADVVGVKLVTTPRLPHALDDPLDAAVGATVPRHDGLDGTGVVVGVVDTGLDSGRLEDLHPDLRGRVASLVSRPIDASWDAVAVHPGADDGAADTNRGHGTFVTGTVVGTGAASQGTKHGVAPGASVVVQAIEQYVDAKPLQEKAFPDGYYLAGRPLDLRDLFESAAGQGARIHVNAWGDAVAGAYTDDAHEVDLFLAEHPEHLVLYASGNLGSDPDADRAPEGTTVYSPACAKNVLAVGATEGPTAGVGERRGWAAFENASRRYPNPADRIDPVSGEPDRIALLTSTGPTPDGRRKPDLCAPGTNLVGLRSLVSSDVGNGIASPQPYYCYRSGTSIAVGVLGGGAALVLQGWRLARRRPTGLGLKAILMMGAAPVLRRGSTTGQREDPQACGWGRLDVAGSLPAGPGHVAWLVDTAADAVDTGGRRGWTLRVPPGGGPVRVALAWYDAPDPRLVDDLDLVVAAPDGITWWGNHPDGAPGRPDTVHTVEVVDLPSATDGLHRIEVAGSRVMTGPRRFALAVRAPRGSRLRGTSGRITPTPS